MLPACDTQFTAARLTLRVIAGRANLSKKKSQLVCVLTERPVRERRNVRRGHPRQEADEAGIRLGHAEERKVARAEARGRRRDDEADDADTERDYDVEVPLADLVAVCRDEEGADGRKEEGRGAEEEGRRVRVAERLGDLREAAGARASVTPPTRRQELDVQLVKREADRDRGEGESHHPDWFEKVVSPRSSCPCGTVSASPRSVERHERDGTHACSRRARAWSRPSC